LLKTIDSQKKEIDNLKGIIRKRNKVLKNTIAPFLEEYIDLLLNEENNEKHLRRVKKLRNQEIKK